MRPTTASALGSGAVTMTAGTLDLGRHALSNSVSIEGTSSIGNGTIDGSVSVKEGAAAHFFGQTYIKDGTVSAVKTTIKALKTDKEGLMQALSVSDGLIAGTGRAASLADGLDISRMGYDLTLENLVLTANNKISVGDGHTITLNNVTIKISDDVCSLVNGIYAMDLKNLIN